MANFSHTSSYLSYLDTPLNALSHLISSNDKLVEYFPIFVSFGTFTWDCNASLKVSFYIFALVYEKSQYNRTSIVKESSGLVNDPKNLAGIWKSQVMSQWQLRMCLTQPETLQPRVFVQLEQWISVFSGHETSPPMGLNGSCMTCSHTQLSKCQRIYPFMPSRRMFSNTISTVDQWKNKCKLVLRTTPKVAYQIDV